MIRELSRCVLLLLIISGVLFSCKSARSSQQEDAFDSGEESSIIFVSLKIFRDSADQEVVELVNRVWAKGTLKKKQEQVNQPFNKPLICEFLDSERRRLSSVSLQNPLTTSFEQYSINGAIERKEATLSTAYFTIRADVSTVATYLQVSNENGKTLGQIALR